MYIKQAKKIHWKDECFSNDNKSVKTLKRLHLGATQIMNSCNKAKNVIIGRIRANEDF